MNVKVYRTVSGDTWDLISFKVYGDEIYYHELIRANPNLIDIAIFDSDRTIMDYARDIWDIKECLPKDYINENK